MIQDWNCMYRVVDNARVEENCSPPYLDKLKARESRLKFMVMLLFQLSV